MIAFICARSIVLVFRHMSRNPNMSTNILLHIVWLKSTMGTKNSNNGDYEASKLDSFSYLIICMTGIWSNYIRLVQNSRWLPLHMTKPTYIIYTFIVLETYNFMNLVNNTFNVNMNYVCRVNKR